MCSLKSRAGAFTLIELLVVIGIMGVLIGILLPVLGMARARARETTCASSLRQVGVAVFMYANENRGYYPIEPTEHNPHPHLMQVLRSELKAGPAIFYCNEAELMEAGAQSPDYTPKGDTDSVIPSEANIAAGNISYVYWSFLANKGGANGTWREPSVFIPRILKTGGAVAVDPLRIVAKATTSERWVACDFFRQGAPFPHSRRHASGLNVLYQDGHVELVLGSPRKSFK